MSCHTKDEGRSSESQRCFEYARPVDVPGVQRCLGMITYLNKFMPKLSDVTTPLRMLTHKGQPWQWNDEQEHSFNMMKNLITESPVMLYFNPKDELVLQCDASQIGLGACLMQQEQPIIYSSRSLTPAESRYAQIEK